MGKHLRKYIEQPTSRPTRKVTTGAFVNAVVVLVVATLQAFDLDPDPLVVSSLTTVVNFIAQYMVRDREVAQ